MDWRPWGEGDERVENQKLAGKMESKGWEQWLACQIGIFCFEVVNQVKFSFLLLH